ncbi:2-oxoacid:acceptor oxidoreductase family protein [Thermosediminibacter oceani]|uniref:Pyruvate/ketoisovalerate oxidoreductase, catalytic domain protein n=1 Tax=Thermosediminibacter oceani (strain ATCC BAA-1034 / DSM 16646 / JW/IW-1228P) TaxID=555079 RepID=D9S2H1_THEOJ|nr:2-oxoacid:acceptor oxidoreductase family protein [Thermosediminibacter oceani]ADL07598.1 Pyruvate/ketoisovalerate oxidoreductase, catalytic domain protein [Thermosediminibacter oceani DSM 16646]
MKVEVIMAGFGGQGIMLMGEILAHSAMLEGREVSWIPSYGPEMRGGTANCMVVVSDKRIPSPIISSPDILVAMNKPSMDKFTPIVKSGGIVILNKALIDEKPARQDIEVIEVDASGIADELGNMKVANMVALGVLVGRTGVVRPETVLKSIDHFLPEHRKNMFEINEKALMRGIEEVKK